MPLVLQLTAPELFYLFIYLFIMKKYDYDYDSHLEVKREDG